MVQSGYQRRSNRRQNKYIRENNNEIIDLEENRGTKRFNHRKSKLIRGKTSENLASEEYLGNLEEK